MSVRQPFDVPGTVTLRDVSRRAPAETPEQRTYRLAQKAVIEGVRILHEHGAGTLFATSSHNASIVYRLDLATPSCPCPGFTRTGICKHIALALLQTGALAKEPAICPECNGRGGVQRSTGGHVTDWVWKTCRECAGTGTV